MACQILAVQNARLFVPARHLDAPIGPAPGAITATFIG